MDPQRAVTLLYAITALSGGVLVRSASLQLAAYRSVEDPVIAGVASVTTLLGVVGAVVTFVLLSRNARANEFCSTAVVELLKVTFPDREDTLNNTGIVVGASVGFGALMFVYDYGWSAITTFALYSGVSN